MEFLVTVILAILAFLSFTISIYIKPKKSRFIALILSFLVFVASIWLGFIQNQPSINISYNDPLRSDNLFTSYFTIQNSGKVDIHNVVVSHRLDSVVANGGGYRNLVIHNVSSSIGYPYFDRIASGRGKTLDINFFEGGLMTLPEDMTTSKGELILWVKYDYWKYLPYFSQTDTFKFHSSRIIDGRILWLEGDRYE